MRLLDLIPASDEAGAESDVGLAPGKATLVDQVGHADRILSSVPGRSMHTDGIAIQRRGIGQAKAGADLQRAAAEGTSGAATTLPHADQIQESFGRHDVGAIRAHVGGAAVTASQELGALAYASGDSVAFAAQPDLHTAAHEAAHVIQQRGGVQLLGGIDGGANDPYEQHADRVADAVVRGESAEALLDASPRGGNAHAGAPVQRKTTVNPVATGRKDKTAVLGDGSPGNPGLTISELNSYVATQADWFNDPSFTAPDRDLVWKVLLLIKPPHMVVALGALRTAAVAALGAGDLAKLNKYAACFDGTTQTVQVSTPATTIARALQLGQAITDLEVFVPLPVLRVVVPEAGLIWLVDNAKAVEFKNYYKDFSPTLETPAEWPYIQEVLTEGVATYGALKGWVHDLHVFTKAARTQLVANVADVSRSRPVLLILFSASDWNTAFQQAANVESAIMNAKNLAIVVQGSASLGAATTMVNRVADDYGQQSRSLDWSTFPPKVVKSKGRLGQVVIAGHGSDQSVEAASDGSGATASADNRYVSYNQQNINSGGDPKTNGTELLIDTVLSRMDPKDANVVFAGCLVGSHDVPPGTNVSGGSAAAQANLQAALAAHPNLADYVRGRMKALGVTGQVQAANGSTTFSSFNVDANGKAGLSNPGDPDIGGTKLQYVRTGVEPEGALRAAIECYADAAIGPAKVTTEIRTRVAGLAGNTGWWETVTRIAFQLCLPSAGDVDIGKMVDVVHRVAPWFFCGWAEMIDVQNLANNVQAAEAPAVMGGMLTSSWASGDHLKVGVNEAWMSFDAGKSAAFMAALDASSLKRETFNRLLARGIVDPKLATLLTGAPTKGKLLIALTIATHDHDGMPAPVKDFLKAAAGGARTTTFPAALGVPALIAPLGELGVLQDIGLAPTSAPPTSSGPTTVDGNVDANKDNKNETFVAVSPREATVTVMALNVRARPNTSAAVLAVVRSGDVVRVMGETEDGWSLIDFNGKTGFVATRFVA